MGDCILNQSLLSNKGSCCVRHSKNHYFGASFVWNSFYKKEPSMLTLQGFNVPASFVLAIAVSACLLSTGCGSKVEAPTAFEVWKDEDGAFSIEYPADWDASGGGKNGVKWAEFTMGSAAIKLDFDMVTSLIGDISQAGAGGGFREEPIDPEEQILRAPVHKAHLFGKKAAEMNYSGYAETAPIVYRAKLGDSRKSEFKSSSIAGSVRGYRATSLTINHGVIIYCTCSPSDWEDLKPAFDRVLASLN
jgi:hypothetical protein